MRFSARSKVGILLSLVTILTLISAFAVTTFMGGRGTQAAHSTHSVTYHGHRTSATSQKLHVTKAVQHTLKKHVAGKQHSALLGHFGKASSAKLNAARQHAPSVAAANASALLGPRTLEGGIMHNFHGLTAAESAVLNGIAVLPPDQALCVGHDGSIAGNPKVVFQIINLAIVETNTSVNVLSSDLLPIDKSEVAAQLTPDKIFADFFNNIVDPNSGVPITSLQPAVSVSPSNVEYLVNSFPFTDQFQDINPTSKALGFWAVLNDEDIPNTDVVLVGTDIASERYAFNIPAASSGDGIVFANQIVANDDRMMQAEFIGGNVWAALDSSVNIAGDPVTRDGVAWFKIGVHSLTVRQQGFIGSPRNNLLFPSIQVTTEGTVGIAFSITGPSLNPTAAYVVRKSGATSFGSIVRANTGLSPSFDGDGNRRWGDYSRATLDTHGLDIWMATEFSEVPNGVDVMIGLNDATQVWNVKGDH